MAPPTNLSGNSIESYCRFYDYYVKSQFYGPLIKTNAIYRNLEIMKNGNYGTEDRFSFANRPFFVKVC